MACEHGVELERHFRDLQELVYTYRLLNDASLDAIQTVLLSRQAVDLKRQAEAAETGAAFGILNDIGGCQIRRQRWWRNCATESCAESLPGP